MPLATMVRKCKFQWRKKRLSGSLRAIPPRLRSPASHMPAPAPGMHRPVSCAIFKPSPRQAAGGVHRKEKKPISSPLANLVASGRVSARYRGSSQGSYIETSRNYQSGTILIMRMVRYPAIPPSTADEDRPRSICLAEVKWRQELAGQNAIGYGIGLRYLD